MYNHLSSEVGCDLLRTLCPTQKSIDGKINDVSYVTNERSVTNESVFTIRSCMSDKRFRRPIRPYFIPIQYIRPYFITIEYELVWLIHFNSQLLFSTFLNQLSPQSPQIGIQNNNSILKLPVIYFTKWLGYLEKRWSICTQHGRREILFARIGGNPILVINRNDEKEEKTKQT